MKKEVSFLLIAALALIFVFAACSSDETPGEAGLMDESYEDAGSENSIEDYAQQELEIGMSATQLQQIGEKIAEIFRKHGFIDVRVEPSQIYFKKAYIDTVTIQVFDDGISAGASIAADMDQINFSDPDHFPDSVDSLADLDKELIYVNGASPAGWELEESPFDPDANIVLPVEDDD
jgi:hypothetical protein